MKPKLKHVIIFIIIVAILAYIAYPYIKDAIYDAQNKSEIAKEWFDIKNKGYNIKK